MLVPIQTVSEEVIIAEIVLMEKQNLKQLTPNWKLPWQSATNDVLGLFATHKLLGLVEYAYNDGITHIQYGETAPSEQFDSPNRRFKHIGRALMAAVYYITIEYALSNKVAPICWFQLMHPEKHHLFAKSVKAVADDASNVSYSVNDRQMRELLTELNLI